MARRSYRFPERAIDEWWWTWRWRYEILEGWIEKETVDWCRENIRAGMNIADVGAHVGYYTRLFADLVGRSGRVFAFEPHPENQEVLRHNIGSRSQVEVVPAAVGSATGTARLFVSAGSSNHSLVEGFTPAVDTIEIPVISLDSFLAERHVSLDLIKIDVEGAEPMVLEGLSSAIDRSKDLTMIVEYNPAALGAGGKDPMDLLADLQRMGFETHPLLPPSTSAELDLPGDGTSNLLCRKRTR